MHGGNSTLNPNANIFVPNNVVVNLVPLNIQFNLPTIDSIEIIPPFRKVSTPNWLDGNDNWPHNDLEMLVRNNVFLTQSKRRLNPKSDPFYPGVVNEDDIQAPFERIDKFPISLNAHKAPLKTKYNLIPLISYSLNPRSDTFIPRNKCHIFNPHADAFIPNVNGSNVTTNPKVVELINAIPAVVNEVFGDITPKEIISGNFDNVDKSILNITPVLHEISTPVLSEVGIWESQNGEESICSSDEDINLNGTLLSQKYMSEEFLDKNDIDHQDVSQVIRQIRVKNVNRVIIGHLNVNFMAPKLDAIRTIIPGNVDIMVFSETKLDDSYPTTQLLIEGFGKPFRLERNARGWWSSYLCQVGHPLQATEQT